MAGFLSTMLGLEGGVPATDGVKPLTAADLMNFIMRTPHLGKIYTDYALSHPLGDASAIPFLPSYSLPIPKPDPRGATFNQRIPQNNLMEDGLPFISSDNFMASRGVGNADPVASPNTIMMPWFYGINRSQSI